MKNILLVILLYVLILPTNASIADSAIAMYKQSDYNKALQLYQPLIDTGVLDANVYYNAGNCYFKMKNISQAIYHYELAKLLDPSNADIQFNLGVANARIVDKIEQRPELFIIGWANNVVSFFSVDSWALIAVVSFVFVLSALLLFFFGKSISYKKLGLTVAVITLIIMLFALVNASIQYNALYKGNYAIITTQVVTGKSAPDPSGTSLFVIHEGLKVKVLDLVGDYAKIGLPDGNSGWITKDSFLKIRL